MIEVRRLSKWYGPIRALNDISFSVGKGEIVGFLGPNGAGKTTTLRILTCFLPATSGSCTLAGHDVFGESLAVRRCIGYLPENTPLYPEMRVEEQLHFFGKLHGLDRNARRKRIDAVSEQCGLDEIRYRLIGQLSKGNRQRVGLAVAMLHDPPILILDEPTAGMDPGQISVIRKLVTSLSEQKTILLSTHILAEVEKTCKRVVIIANGGIVADGTPTELRAKVRRKARILVEVKAKGEMVRNAFMAVDGVSEIKVEEKDGWSYVAVSGNEDGGDIRETLGRVIVAQGWAFREMRHDVGSLEEYFVQITGKQTERSA